jgi:HSP20 family protein
MTRRNLDELETLIADLWHGTRFITGHGFRPNVDSYQTDDPHELTVVVELPGVDPESIAVIAAERVLIVAGERPRPARPGRVYQQMEIAYGPFQRQVRLPEDVDPARARAEYERGILRVSLPITGRPEPRKQIAITVHLA